MVLLCDGTEICRCAKDRGKDYREEQGSTSGGEGDIEEVEVERGLSEIDTPVQGEFRENPRKISRFFSLRLDSCFLPRVGSVSIYCVRARGGRQEQMEVVEMRICQLLARSTFFCNSIDRTAHWVALDTAHQDVIFSEPSQPGLSKMTSDNEPAQSRMSAQVSLSSTRVQREELLTLCRPLWLLVFSLILVF